MGVKKLCFIGMLTVILFVSEQALSFIPSVQLTLFLIVLYAAVLGPYNTTLIVIVHVLTDNLVMGSFTPTIMIPMFLGYESIALIAYALRNKKLAVICIGSAIGCMFYSLSFAIFNVFIFDIDLKKYLIADIPFTLILISSTILCITFLYKPLEKVMIQEWKKI